MSQPQPNSNRTLWLLVLGLLATVLISLGLGRYALSLEQILTLLYQRITALPMPAIESQVLFDVRLPRILIAGLVGAGLALSGAVLQGVFRNPLVDPHVIGVSSGAAFGGTLAIFFSLSTLTLFANTLTFGIATLVLVFLFNRRVASDNLLMLILTGMILNGFFAALVSLLQYISDTEEKLPSIVFWLMGSFTTANGQKLLFFALPWTLCSAVLLGLTRSLGGKNSWC